MTFRRIATIWTGMFSVLLAVSEFLKANWKVAALLLAALGAYLALSHYGSQREAKGAAKAELKAAIQHDAAVGEARSDERLAQEASDKIAAELTRRQEDQTAAQAATVKEIQSATHDLSSADADRRAAALARLRDGSNAAVDSANRAAIYSGPAD